MAVTIADVEALSSMGWEQLDDTNKQEMLDIADNLLSNQFSEDVATLPIVEGNRDDAHKLLTAHLWELSEGGEAQSENATGGSINYNTVTGESIDGLTETRYGRMFKSEYLRAKSGVGVVRTW